MALMKIMGHLRDVKEGKATVGWLKRIVEIPNQVHVH
jgi:hypothetical protein